MASTVLTARACCFPQNGRDVYCRGADCSRSSALFRRRFSPKSRRRSSPGNGYASGTRVRSRRPGDYFVQEVAGESLIIVRDETGACTGFYNVCRHRGTRLCEEATRTCGAIQCPYHAWTYALDGRLTGAPHMDEVGFREGGNIRCMPVKLALWEGFIFVSLADNPTPLEEGVRSASGKFAHWNLPQLRSARGSIMMCRRTGS